MELCDLLGHPDSEKRQLACFVVGLVGDQQVVGCLARCLHDENEHVARFAEHALWSVWFRLGTAKASGLFHEGVAQLSAERYEQAESLFSQAIEADPDFAEAYNQRAIVYHLTDRHRESIRDCKAAVARMPTHFGAVCGMGHGHALLHEPEEALECYRKALAINPNMDAIRDAVHRLSVFDPED